MGTVLLLASLAGVAFGVYMALDPKTREPGKLFAVWWVPAVAAASGVLMRDVVTFVVGFFCFLVAGAAFTLEHGIARKPTVRRNGEQRNGSQKTTRENEAGDNKAVY
jgi:hypothetical protein